MRSDPADPSVAKEPPRGPLLGLDRRDAAFIAALFLLATLAFSAWLFAPVQMAPGMPGHDAETQWYPWRAFAFDQIRQGHLPLWNPYILCGTPFLGNFQSAMLYPPNLLFLIPDVGLAARDSLLLHLWLSLLFTYLLARLLKCGRVGASVAAMSFTFCAAQWLRIPAGHWGVSTAIPWLPLILFCVEWQFRRPGRWPVMVGGLAVGMQVLAGVPQYVFISAIAAGLYALVRGLLQYRGNVITESTEGTENGVQIDGASEAVAPKNPLPSSVPSVSSVVKTSPLVGWAGFVAMYLLGAALSAVQLLPGLEAGSYGARSLPMRKEWLELFSLAPENLLTMFVPGLFGGEGGSAYWGRFYFWEMNAYVGIVALALVVAAFLLVKPRRRTLILGIPAVILLLLAMGKHTPLMGIVSALLPFSEMFRGASKFFMPFSLMLALLAGLGARAVLEAEVRTRKELYIPLALSVVIGGAITYLLYALPSLFDWVVGSGESFSSASEGFDAAQEAIFQAATVSFMMAFLVMSLAVFKARSAGRKMAVLLLVTLDLFIFTQQFAGEWATFAPARPTSHVGAPNGAQSAVRMRSQYVLSRRGENGAMIHGQFLTAGGIEPNPPVRYHILVRTALGLPLDIAPSVYTLDGAPEWLLMNVADAKGPDAAPPRSTRAMLLFQSRIAATAEESLSLLPTTDPANVVILENPAITPMKSNLSGKSCPITSADCDHVVVQCDADREGWLVLRDNYFPGWVATVDGMESPIEIANFSFRAVSVPSGKHVVEFTYQPTSYRIGLALSLISLLGCVLVVIHPLIRRR